MRFLIIVLIASCATTAAADLYRWVDPESGSIKFSNYPPPWYGDPARERRSPKVEVIREINPPPAAPKREEEPRRQTWPAATPADTTPDGPAGKAPDGRAEEPVERPAAKSADKPAAPPELDESKDRRTDGR